MTNAKPRHRDRVPAAPLLTAEALRKAEIVQRLMEVGDHVREVITAALLESGAPSSASGTLWALATSPGPITLREVAAKLGRDPSTVTLAVDKLEAAGVVARKHHPTDGRKRTLALTGPGLKLLQTLRGRLHESTLFAGLSSGQQRALLELLRRIGWRSSVDGTASARSRSSGGRRRPRS